VSGSSGTSGESGTSGVSGTAGTSGINGVNTINISAGAVSQDLSAVVFSNAGGVSFGLNAGTITASAPGGGAANTYTALSYNNRQLGASTNTIPGQNSVWLAPFYIGQNISAATGLHMVSITGTVTSNQTNTVNLTWGAALYQVTGTNQSRYDTIYSTTLGFTFWNSGTASVSFSYNGGSSSSAGSNLMTASIYGNRLLTFNIGSTFAPGDYAWGFRQSTASTGNSSVMRSFNAVMDNPLPLAQGLFLAATNASIGYVEAGTYSVTSASMPVSFLASQIIQTNNVVPYFKMGAI
jgi:hypothetical protein